MNVDLVDTNKPSLGHPILLAGIFLSIMRILAFYTLTVFLLGFWYGGKKGKAMNKKEVGVNKLTMPQVTYSAVRKAQHPRFEYSPLTDGCWTI